MAYSNADSIFNDEYPPMGPDHSSSTTSAEVHTLREQIRQLNFQHGTEVFNLQSRVNALSSQNWKLRDSLSKVELECKKLRNELSERQQEAELLDTGKLLFTNSDRAILTFSSIT